MIFRKIKSITQLPRNVNKIKMNSVYYCLRLSLLKKFKNWILKIQKRILRLFTKQINPRSLGSWRIKGTEESLHRVDSLVLLTRHDWSE